MTPTIVVLARDARRAKTRLRGVLVTDSHTIGRRARATGALTLVVPARGTRDGARQGARRAERDGAEAVLIVAADVPLVRGADLRRVAAAGRRSAVVIVPDRDRSGTNALYLRPPLRIAPRFGRESFTAHRTAAGGDGRSLTVARISLDIDTDTDLALLRRHRRRAGQRTRAALATA